LRRILRLLAEYRAQATFFVPGGSAVTYPRAVAAIQAAGHEVGHHGWIHENPVRLSLDDERRILERGIAALEQVTGVRPAGYRSPSWDNSPNTVRLLLEHGFEYESSLMGNDFEPYWCRMGDHWSMDEPFKFGEPTALVEMPVAWHLDDWPWFEFIPGQGQGLRTPSAVLEVWKSEFDYLYNEIGQGVMVITMHPQCTGRGHRLMMLNEFIEYVLDHSGAGFTKCIDFVRRWRVGKAPCLPADVG
jgi:peptidoglycan/xylan/chitin deacetylase (PgdA/CDA1 family)